MNEFAIVCEGPTDDAVLKQILLGWFENQPADPFFNLSQPPIKANRQPWEKPGVLEPGGWENVLRYLREKKYQKALQLADYMIVQIDTDESHHSNFGVERDNDPSVMVNRVKERLHEIIGEEDLNRYGNQFIFAICVNKTECWLLPLWDKENPDSCDGCMYKLKTALLNANPPIYSDKKSPRYYEKKKSRGESNRNPEVEQIRIDPEDKHPPDYEKMAKPYSERAILLEKGALNPSLKVFLEELERRNITLSLE